MTPDPAVVLVHERLEQAVSAMPTPDIEAGWAALAARLDTPLAPVVPLRTPTRGRTVVLAVAAALMLAGGAFAAVAHFGDGRTDHVEPVVPRVHVPVTGPHTHAPFSGPPAGTKPRGHQGGSGSARGTSGGTGTGAGSRDGGSATNSGDGGGTTSKPGDDPNDRDQGTGNDGAHNDHGGGNDGKEGSKPHPSGGSSHGGSDH